MDAVADTLRALRRQLAALEPFAVPETGLVSLGHPAVDGALGGGLQRGALHEVFAGAVADMGATAGFVAALALRSATAERRTLWVRQAFSETETGTLYPAGLRELGFLPDRVFVVRAADGAGVLRAGLEGARSSALAAIVIEPWGMPKALDLTATRRLALAAARSGVVVFLLRVGALPQPSAALTRWQVAASRSRTLAANAPGHPAFDITLLRHRAGPAGQRWHLEWDRDQQSFRDAAALPGPVVSVPADRPLVADGRAFARAG